MSTRSKEEKAGSKAIQLKREDEDEEEDRKKPGYTWVDPDWNI